MKKFLLFIFITSYLSSCSNQIFILNKGHKLVKKPSYSEEKVFKNWGIGEEQVIYNPEKYCRKNEALAKIEFKQRRYLLQILTFGYIQSRNIEIYCLNIQS